MDLSCFPDQWSWCHGLEDDLLVYFWSGHVEGYGCGPGDMQDDNAPLSEKVWFDKLNNECGVLQWSSQSPDLNPAELGSSGD